MQNSRICILYTWDGTPLLASILSTAGADIWNHSHHKQDERTITRLGSLVRDERGPDSHDHQAAREKWRQGRTLHYCAQIYRALIGQGDPWLACYWSRLLRQDGIHYSAPRRLTGNSNRKELPRSVSVTWHMPPVIVTKPGIMIWTYYHRTLTLWHLDTGPHLLSVSTNIKPS